MSGFIVHDGRLPVNATATRPRGDASGLNRRHTDPGAVALAAELKAYNRLSAGELARGADALALTPPPLQAVLWPHLVAIARVASERLLVLSVVDGAGGQEVA